MTDPRDIQGSDADVAEGGLNAAAAYAQPFGNTFMRMAREAATQVEERTKDAPGDPNAAQGREYDAGR